MLVCTVGDLTKMRIVSNGGGTQIATLGATATRDFVAARVLDERLFAGGTLADESGRNGFFDGNAT